MSESDKHIESIDTGNGASPEVRLELSRDGVERVLSLYAQREWYEDGRSTNQLTWGFFWRSARRYWQLLVLLAVIGIALGALAARWLPPIYRVSAQVMLVRQNLDGDTSSASFGSGFVATQAEVLQSPEIISQALDRVVSEAVVDPAELTLDAALEAVHAAPISGTQVIALGYIGGDARFGAALINAMVDVFRATLGREETERQQRRLNAKKTEMDALAAERERLFSRLDALRERYRTAGDIGTAADTISARIEDIASQMAAARRDRLAVEVAPVAGPRADPGREIVLKRVAESLSAAEAELERLRRTLTPEHPSVRSAAREVEILEAQWRKAESSAGSGGAALTDTRGLRELEAELQNELENAQRRLDVLQSALPEEERIEGEIERVGTTIDARRRELMDQQVLLTLAEAGDVGATARLIAPPVPPDTPFWPNLSLLVAGGACIGAGIGWIVAIVRVREGSGALVAP